jgi:hypothetical protein
VVTLQSWFKGEQMKMPKSIPTVAKVCMAALCMLAFSFTSRAGDQFIYGNNAGGTDIVYQIDLTTGGNVTNQYNVSSGNGRGVVVVGNIMYTTTASSGNVYAYNLTTNTSLGVAFTVAGASALSTMAFDGTNFWIGDYSGTNNVYHYTPTGTLLGTVPLSKCTGYCDGLEYLAAGGGELLSNRSDGGYGAGTYDLYSTTGTLIKAAFIDQSTDPNGCGGATGVAFDGTNYFVSCVFASKLMEFNSSGTFVKDIHITGASPLIEDLSVDYKQVLTQTPEPASLSLLSFGLAGIGLIRRKKTA